jgi:hypothetical protein
MFNKCLTNTLCDLTGNGLFLQVKVNVRIILPNVNHVLTLT